MEENCQMLLSSHREPVANFLSAHYKARLMLVVEVYGVLIVFQVFLHMPSHLIITTLRGGNKGQM